MASTAFFASRVFVQNIFSDRVPKAHPSRHGLSFSSVHRVTQSVNALRCVNDPVEPCIPWSKRYSILTKHVLDVNLASHVLTSRQVNHRDVLARANVFLGVGRQSNIRDTVKGNLSAVRALGSRWASPLKYLNHSNPFVQSRSFIVLSNQEVRQLTPFGHFAAKIPHKLLVRVTVTWDKQVHPAHLLPSFRELLDGVLDRHHLGLSCKLNRLPCALDLVLNQLKVNRSNLE